MCCSHWMLLTTLGQWSAIAGAALAALGSVYVLLATDMDAVERTANLDHSARRGHSDEHHNRRHSGLAGSREDREKGRDTPLSLQEDGKGSPSIQDRRRAPPTSPRASPRTMTIPHDRDDTSSQGSSTRESHDEPPPTTDAGYRRKVAQTLIRFGNYLGNQTNDMFDESRFRTGRAQEFPQVPGEEHRNPELGRIQEQSRIIHEQRSRAGSFRASDTSGPQVEPPSSPRLSLPLPSPKIERTLSPQRI